MIDSVWINRGSDYHRFSWGTGTSRFVFSVRDKSYLSILLGLEPLKGDGPLTQQQPLTMLHLLSCFGYLHVSSRCLVSYQHKYVIFPPLRLVFVARMNLVHNLLYCYCCFGWRLQIDYIYQEFALDHHIGPIFDWAFFSNSCGMTELLHRYFKDLPVEY